MNILLLLITLIVLLPCITAITVLFSPHQIARYSIMLVLSICGMLLMGLTTLLYVKMGCPTLTSNIFPLLPGHLAFSFQIEPLSLVFGILISILWPITLMYTISYAKAQSGLTKMEDNNRFYCFLGLAICATLGIAFAGNLVTTFLFYELLTLVTYPLVTINKHDKDAAAGRVYLGILVSTSMLLFLPAIFFIYSSTGSTTYTPGGLHFTTTPVASICIFVMLLFGVAKAGIMPFHRWLPKAMVAPSPVSSILHAVSVVKSGVFILMKIVVYIFGSSYLNHCTLQVFGFNILIIIPTITIILAAIVNLWQTNYKIILAYSTISQLSYIILCILLFDKYSLIAAILYFVAHALAKIVLFFQAGSYLCIFEEYSIYGLAGVGLPHKMGASTMAGMIGAYSILGLPFTLGFISKFYLIKAVLNSEAYWVLLLICLSLLCSAIYFFKSFYSFYFSPASRENIQHFKSGDNRYILYMVVAMLLVSIINVAMFFNYDIIPTLLSKMSIA